MSDTPADLSLVRLLQLASPALPIGTYSYSQGMEWVVEKGTVHDAVTAAGWIGDLLDLIVAPGEAAVVSRLLAAAGGRDWRAFGQWNHWFCVSRETAELRAETEQMGAALIKLALALELLDAEAAAEIAAERATSLPAAYVLSARGFGVPRDAALVAYVWMWLEAQVACAIKCVPLGQAAGQRLLKTLGGRIPAAVTLARATLDEDVTSFAPGLALASARHETQYTRLFRS
ncbi:MAG: urease accessory protein UreF [Pseudomonadota bacterium]|nr:urease accessory protein UreF [Pseudomonadota bacterium]